MKHLFLFLGVALALGGCSGVTGNVPGNGPGWATLTVVVSHPSGLPVGAGVAVTEEEVGGALSVESTNGSSAVNFPVQSNSSKRWCVAAGNNVMPNPNDAVHTACVTGPLAPQATAILNIATTK